MAKKPVYPRWRGNTGEVSGLTARQLVYPRWRGEHFRDRFDEWPNGGLSPLARGTPHRLISI